MTQKMKYISLAAAFALALAVGSAAMIGVDETLNLFKGLVGIAQGVK